MDILLFKHQRFKVKIESLKEIIIEEKLEVIRIVETM